MKFLTESKNPVDKVFLIIVVILLTFGIFIFSSASLGLLARGESFVAVALKQFVVGIVGGGIGAYMLSRFHYRNLRKIAFWFFVASVFLTALVFVPGLGYSHGGATRWLNIGGFRLQPAEFLKLGTVMYLSALFSSKHIQPDKFRQGFLPLFGVLGIVSGLLYMQPDTGTLAVIVFTSGVLYFIAGARWKHIATLGIICALAIAGLTISKHYIFDRIVTFLNPQNDAQGAGYQVQKALLAVGSGQIFGRGFGQSVQKFNLLPEPVGDSIFAVAAEEFGFIGSVTIVLLFLFFTLRGLYLAARAPDTFARLLIIGIVILISSQSFVNIGTMIGLVPLTGVPLLFISQGGTALLAALLGVGIILNISRYRT
ncbi:MAG: FtsW/RodA/SpoVE family cell cycle protein [bacterium]|nr:FtsW/RodA/SpoVE family cell cycle protein [bacterium]